LKVPAFGRNNGACGLILIIHYLYLEPNLIAHYLIDTLISYRFSVGSIVFVRSLPITLVAYCTNVQLFDYLAINDCTWPTTIYLWSMITW